MYLVGTRYLVITYYVLRGNNLCAPALVLNSFITYLLLVNVSRIRRIIPSKFYSYFSETLHRTP